MPMTALGLDAWWDDPHYRQCYTVNLRGEFILMKLLERDPPKLRAVMVDLYRDNEPLAGSITALEWHMILAAMGASPAEIADVQARMGRGAVPD
jgi:hypothetical protein